jgi:hypothetical protein
VVEASKKAANLRLEAKRIGIVPHSFASWAKVFRFGEGVKLILPAKRYRPKDVVSGSLANPSPCRGEEGSAAKWWEVRELADSFLQALTLPLRGPLPLPYRERD